MVSSNFRACVPVDNALRYVPFPRSANSLTFVCVMSLPLLLLHRLARAAAHDAVLIYCDEVFMLFFSFKGSSPLRKENR